MLLIKQIACWLLFSLVQNSWGATKTIRGKWLEVTVGTDEFSVVDHGAKGDGKHDDTHAIQAAFDAAASVKEGGTVVFPSGGTYLTTAFHFSSSHTAMYLPFGARVVFDNDQTKYDGSHHMIEMQKVSHVAIIGGGIIDGKGADWWACRATGCYRPRLLSVGHTDHLLIEGVVFKDSPNHVLELYSDFTELSSVTVLNPPSETDKVPVNGTFGPSHNTDAVDVHGTPFYIHDCHFDTGDDNVAVHASDLLVEDCYFGHGHGASIGSCGSDTALSNITFRNIIFNGTGSAMKIKTHSGAKRSYVRDSTWENLVLYNVQATVTIDMFYDHGKNTSTDFKISNITVRNVTAYGTETDFGKTVVPGTFHCQESSPCHGIHLEDITHVDSKSSFDCYNAFGTWKNVVPAPCLRKEDTIPLVV
eukprot:TRINITY_DN49170_c0_g1_i1.p1 TRINITY_DN49170_c0_g1~~TRINITY_DN49170_c0_g1_i1.p1  ORF type:complete len:417 (+),score=56.99 TRINITY_DN49170_c0_g1_i1:89-1339(+)